MASHSSPLSAASPAYLEALLESYRSDPESIDYSWRCVFQMLDALESGWSDQLAPSIDALRIAYRQRGHLVADLNPLALACGGDDADAMIGAELGASTFPGDAAGPTSVPEPMSAAALARHLRSRYCATLTVESAHIDDVRIRRWLEGTVEGHEPSADSEGRLRALDLLCAADEFEGLLALRLPTKKRFGIEGATSLVPLLDRVLQRAAAEGVDRVLIGTMHRGRLNLLANVLGKPPEDLFAEFKGRHPFPDDPGFAADVAYHLGFESELAMPAGTLHVSVSPNPSHLEAVNPVVQGRARARQDMVGDSRRVLCVLLHTDASVAAQGIVSEALQLSATEGHGNAGVVHLVVNNQIGFTTSPAEARSSRHATGAWKAIDSPIFHVNGDDPDAVLRAADLAVSFRQAFGRDVVVDLVCYRRNGHNEFDEPRFTQPVEYELIDRMPPVTAVYRRRLVDEGLTTEEAVDRRISAYRSRFEEAFRRGLQPPSGEHPVRVGKCRNGELVGRVGTGVAQSQLRRLADAIATPPADMVLNDRLAKMIRRRAERLDGGLDWALAEALAIASLLAEGVPVRMSGQDAVRGAFSQRHFALTDVRSGQRHISLNHLGIEQARFDIINSPLSEYAVLGFEYGYSVERPEALVIWEAQFGDFANGAQIVIDQFIASGEEKWRQRSGLVVLLPHGLEGQGPEHSSARLERFLQLAACGNIRIAHPSTPANYFHLLRRQMHGDVRKPLIVFSPKTLLRLPAAVSPLSKFGIGEAFEPVIASTQGDDVRRVALCSGKIAYEIEAERERAGAAHVAVVRLEELYPLPADELVRLFSRWPMAEYVWVQEEPRNMGAWTYLDRRLEAVLVRAGVRRPRVECLSRPESASPAGCFHGEHEATQRELVRAAVGCII